MTNEQPGEGAVVRRSLLKETSLHEWMQNMYDIVGDNRNILHDRMLKEFSDNLLEWPGKVREIFDYWFSREFRDRKARAIQAEHRAKRNRLIADGLAQIRVQENRIRVEAKIELITMMLPNGKQLGECTFGEVAAITSVHRSFLERVARQGRPRQKVKTVLDEARLLEIWNTGGANNLNDG